MTWLHNTFLKKEEEKGEQIKRHGDAMLKVDKDSYGGNHRSYAGGEWTKYIFCKKNG